MNSKKTQKITAKNTFVPPKFSFPDNGSSASPNQPRTNAPGAPTFQPPPMAKQQQTYTFHAPPQTKQQFTSPTQTMSPMTMQQQQYQQYYYPNQFNPQFQQYYQQYHQQYHQQYYQQPGLYQSNWQQGAQQFSNGLQSSSPQMIQQQYQYGAYNTQQGGQPFYQQPQQPQQSQSQQQQPQQSQPQSQQPQQSQPQSQQLQFSGDQIQSQPPQQPQRPQFTSGSLQLQQSIPPGPPLINVEDKKDPQPIADKLGGEKLIVEEPKEGTATKIYDVKPTAMTGPIDSDINKIDDEKPLGLNDEIKPDGKEKSINPGKTKEADGDSKGSDKPTDTKGGKEGPNGSLSDSTSKKAEEEYTLETISGHENDVLQKFIQTKDPKYSELLLGHYSRTGIKFDFAQANMLFSNLVPLKDDEAVSGLLLSILTANLQLCTIARVKVLLNPEYVLGLKEKDLATVTGVLRSVLTAAKYAGNKAEEIISSLVGLLAVNPPRGLPAPLWGLLEEAATAGKAKVPAYEPVLRHMVSNPVEGETLECAVRILTKLAEQQKDLSTYRVLLEAHARYGAAPCFFDFFLRACAKTFAKGGKRAAKDSAQPDDFARALAAVVLDEASPNKRNVSVLRALASVYARKPRPRAPDAKALSLKAARTFIAEAKDTPALVAALTILRGATTLGATAKVGKGKGEEGEEKEEGTLITETIFDCPQALEDGAVVTLLCLAMQREALRRELTEKELKVLGTLAVRDGVDTPLFAILAGVAANALCARGAGNGGRPGTPCERLRGLVGALAGKVAAAPAPIRSAELLSNFFLVVKNVAAGAIAFGGAHSELLAERWDQIVKVLGDHAPFLYDACTKRPKSTLVKHLVKALLEVALLLARAKFLPRRMYDAVDNFYRYFGAQGDQPGAKEIRNVALKIYLVNTSLGDVGKVLLTQSKCRVLHLLVGELAQCAQNSGGGVNTGRVVAIFGVLCNVLCLDVPKDALDTEKAVEATLRLLGARKFPAAVTVAGSRLVWRVAARKGGKALVERHSEAFVNCFAKVLSEVGEPSGKEGEAEGIATILNAFIFVVVGSKSVVKALREDHASRICTFANKIKPCTSVLQTTTRLIKYLMKQNKNLNSWFRKYQLDPEVRKYIFI